MWSGQGFYKHCIEYYPPGHPKAGKCKKYADNPPNTWLPPKGYTGNAAALKRKELRELGHAPYRGVSIKPLLRPRKRPPTPPPIPKPPKPRKPRNLSSISSAVRADIESIERDLDRIALNMRRI